MGALGFFLCGACFLYVIGFSFGVVLFKGRSYCTYAPFLLYLHAVLIALARLMCGALPP